MNKLLVMFLSIAAFSYTSCKTKVNIVDKENVVTKQFNEASFNPYFSGLGTEPFWNVKIDDQFIVYTTPENKKEIFIINENSKLANQENQTISGANTNHKIDLVVTKGECSDGMSDQIFTHQIKLQIQGKSINTQQNGCGKFMVAKNLVGKWELSALNDEEIAANKYLKTPYIEFNEDNFSVVGNSSCNGFSGLVTLNENEMKFSKVAVTKMMCVHDNIEQSFLKEFNTITNYKLNGGILELYANTSLKMKLNKVK